MNELLSGKLFYTSRNANVEIRIELSYFFIVVWSLKAAKKFIVLRFVACFEILSSDWIEGEGRELKRLLNLHCLYQIIIINCQKMRHKTQHNRQFSLIRLKYSPSPDQNISKSVSKLSKANQNSRINNNDDQLYHGIKKNQKILETNTKIQQDQAGTSLPLKHRNDKSKSYAFLQVSNYLKKQMIQAQRKKQQISQQIKHQAQQAFIQSQRYAKQKQNNLQRLKQQRILLKESLQKQIVQKKQRNHTQAEAKKDKYYFKPLIQTQNQQKAQQNSLKYQQALRKQISQRQNDRIAAREIMKQQKEKENFIIIERLEQYRQQQAKINQIKKEQLLHQRCKQIQDKSFKNKQQLQKNRRSKQQARKKMVTEQRQAQEVQNTKRKQKINSYLKDLRMQISSNEIKRRTQFQKLNQNVQNTGFIIKKG